MMFTNLLLMPVGQLKREAMFVTQQKTLNGTSSENSYCISRSQERGDTERHKTISPTPLLSHAQSQHFSQLILRI